MEVKVVPSENLSFAINLKKKRKEKGLTQEQLAEKIGRTKGCISNWERGYRDAGFDEIVAVAEALEIDPQLLVERRNNIKKEDKNV